MNSSRAGLSGVPEESSPTSPHSPVNLPSSPSTPTQNLPPNPRSTVVPGAVRKPSSLRTLGGERASRSSIDVSAGDSKTTKRHASSSSLNAFSSATTLKETKLSKTSTPPSPAAPFQKIRSTPRLPHDADVKLAPATIMYWSRAPVYGAIPVRGMRAHSVTLVDNMAWLFGGCDDKDCWKDVFCFDTETMQWSHPDTNGDIPPPCRAHTATLVDRKIVVFGGGQGPVYYNSVYILDTVTRRWTHPKFDTNVPASRRAHTAVSYQNKIWVFGGGNGMQALNDLWTLDVGVPIDKMKWEEVETRGRKPNARGYHTANLVGNVMIVVGGSDGKECFPDIWCLNLDTLIWSQVKLQKSHRRLSHSTTQVGSYLFVMGGHDGSEYSSEVLLFNLVSLQYEARHIIGKPPSPRGYHAAILADSRLFVFGGFNGHVVYDDVYILDLAAAAYLPQRVGTRDGVAGGGGVARLEATVLNSRLMAFVQIQS